MKKHLSRGLLAFSCATALAVPATAQAAPVTVNLRIEGPTKTLFEGPVTTDVRPFRFTEPATEYQCDGTTSGGNEPAPTTTRGAAVTAAALATPFTTKGSFSSFGPSFTEIAGENVAFDGTSRFLAEYKNFQFASKGSCGDPIANGDDVLFAYGDGSEALLRLSGPSTARPGEPFAVKVINGSDSTSVAGASVGGATTDTAGAASVTLSQRGATTLKATKSGAIRSNGLTVCVTDGQDGFCGTKTPEGETVEPPPAATTTPVPVPAVDTQPPFGKITSVREQQVFPRGRGPRELSGSIDDRSGVAEVRLRLTRTVGRRCSVWSGTKERFVRNRCGIGNAWSFSAGSSANWSYLLPNRLGRGRYVLDVETVDTAGNRDTQRRRGTNRIVFFVR
jgi:hypothetical protein